MKRLILAAVAAAALSAPAMAANCAKDYKDFWQSLDREKFWHVVHGFLTMPSRAGS